MKDEVFKVVKKTEIKTLTGLLKSLKSSIQDVEASSVVSVDGFMLASALPQTTHQERVAVMSAAIHSLGETAARELGRGELSEVYVKGENGSVVVIPSGKNAVLTTLTRADNGSDSVSQDMKRTADEVAKLV